MSDLRSKGILFFVITTFFVDKSKINFYKQNRFFIIDKKKNQNRKESLKYAKLYDLDGMQKFTYGNVCHWKKMYVVRRVKGTFLPE